jgi:hypothetical protein
VPADHRPPRRTYLPATSAALCPAAPERSRIGLTGAEPTAGRLGPVPAVGASAAAFVVPALAGKAVVSVGVRMIVV